MKANIQFIKILSLYYFLMISHSAIWAQGRHDFPEPLAQKMQTLPQIIPLPEGFKIDIKEVHDDHTMHSGKKDDIRFYHFILSKKYKFSSDHLIKAILSYENRCNNDYRDERIFMDKSYDCKLHNENLIETKIVPIVNLSFLEGFNIKPLQYFMINRRASNNGTHQHQEAIYYFKKNRENLIFQHMIDGKIFKKWTGLNNKAEHDSPMIDQQTFFHFNKAREEVELTFSFILYTDHWLINKDIAASRVQESAIRGAKHMLNSLESFAPDEVEISSQQAQ